MRQLVACVVLIALAGCGPSQDAIDDAAAQTCGEVRAGIAAFNERDYPETVERFAKAKPFAQKYAELSDDQRADDLLEAVKYYAELPADEYREAFKTSARFLKYKKITLGQCESGTTV